MKLKTLSAVIALSAEEDSYGIRGRMFFTEGFSAEVSYATADDADIVAIGANLRF